jgi:hypothetical protein
MRFLFIPLLLVSLFFIAFLSKSYVNKMDGSAGVLGCLDLLTYMQTTKRLPYQYGLEYINFCKSLKDVSKLEGYKGEISPQETPVGEEIKESCERCKAFKVPYKACGVTTRECR